MSQLLRTVHVTGFLCLLSFIGFFTVAGCSETQFSVSPAKGSVSCNGAPVTTGTVSFTPIGEPGRLETGKSATAAIGPDGTFVLTTFDRFDGAVIGKHRVEYIGSDGEDEETELRSEGENEPTLIPQQIRQRATAKTLCVLNGEMIVDVIDGGENNFRIELVTGQPESESGSDSESGDE